MSRELIENVYSSGRSHCPNFSHCGRFIFFLKECGEDNPVLKVTNLEGDEFNAIIDSKNSKNIIEIHASQLTNHLAILTQDGREKAQIHVFEWEIKGLELTSDLKYSTTVAGENKKHFWGGFDNDGCVFFRLENKEIDDSWMLVKCFFGGDQLDPIASAGYFPEMIGKLGEEWVWRNKVTTTKSKLNGKGETINARIRSARSNPSGKLYAIIDSEDACAGKISGISFGQEMAPMLQHDEDLVDQEWVMGNLLRDSAGNIPLGELHEFVFVSEKKILFHFNENGTSKLRLADLQQLDNAKEIYLGQIHKVCGGEVWINTMKISPNKKHVILEVVNYNVSENLWLFDIGESKFNQLISPADTFDIQTDISIFHTELMLHGPISMHYYEVKSTNIEQFKGTVIFFHGGPAVQTHVGRYFDRIVTLAKAGYTVIAPNPAGSLGRGGKHINLDNGNRRIPQFNDQIIPFVEEKIALHDSVHLFGGSYAGWLISKVLNHDIGAKIKSAVVRNGVLKWQTFFDKTPPFRKKHRAWEYVGEASFESENALEILAKLSLGNDLGCKNVLFFTGEKDARVPSESTKEFLGECGFSAEEVQDIHHEYPEEGHTIKKYGNRIDIMTKTLDLFSRNSD